MHTSSRRSAFFVEFPRLQREPYSSKRFADAKGVLRFLIRQPLNHTLVDERMIPTKLGDGGSHGFLHLIDQPWNWRYDNLGVRSDFPRGGLSSQGGIAAPERPDAAETLSCGRAVDSITAIVVRHGFSSARREAANSRVPCVFGAAILAAWRIRMFSSQICSL